MRRCFGSDQAGQPRVLDPVCLPGELREAATTVQIQRRRMVKIAGVHPQPPDVAVPGAADGEAQEPWPEAASDIGRQQAEIGQFGLVRLPAVEFA